MKTAKSALPSLHLASGAAGPAVTEVRARLVRLGLLVINGSSDVFDLKVDAAVRVFQQERGITIDGIVGPLTFRRLEEARWNLGDRIVSYSAGRATAGDDIAELQRRLNALGFVAGRVDGVFGPDTDRALREFQHNVGIAEDGTCGPEVWRALDRLARHVTGGEVQQLRSDFDHALVRTGISGKVIVLDPGHGGPDHGMVSNRLAESIVADDLCRRIEGRLAAIGTQVLISRPMSYELDHTIDETRRAVFANENGAHLVVSLHADAEPSGRANGISTYYYGHPQDRSVLGQHFAELVQSEIVSRTDLADCRVHAKTWDLLRVTRMPAVRIEFGYLTNKHDAQRLADASFRDVVAESVAVAILRFFAPESTTCPDAGH